MRLSTVFAFLFAALAIAAPADEVNDGNEDVSRCIRDRYERCLRVGKAIF